MALAASGTDGRKWRKCSERETAPVGFLATDRYIESSECAVRMLMESAVNLEEVAETREGAASDELARALLPLRAVSEDLHERAVAYVLSGDPEDVVEHVWQESETDALFGGVGALNRGLHVSDDLADRLSAVGVAWPSDMREPLKDRRRVLYALRDSLYRHDALSAQQWWRYGQLLRAIWAADTPGKKDWRRKPLTPLWLLLLNEDVVKTVAPWEEKAVDMAKELPTWVPERFAEVLALDGVKAGKLLSQVLTLWLSRHSYSHGEGRAPCHLPGIAEYLQSQGSRIPASFIRSLGDYNRRDLVLLLADLDMDLDPVAHLLVPLTLEEERETRLQAIDMLSRVPDARRREALAELLSGKAIRSKAGSKRSTDLLEYLAEGPDADLLDVTAENNPVLAVAVEQLRARAAFSQCAAQESEQAPVVLPEVEHIALDQPADTARQQLWRILNRIVDDAWDPHGAESREEAAARYLATEQDVEDFVAVAEGRSTGVPVILKKYGFGWVGSFVPALSVVHRLRLAVNDPSIRWRDTLLAAADPRAIEAVLRHFNLPIDDAVHHVFWRTGDPEMLWPWVWEHLDVLAEGLDSSENVPRALDILEVFPRLPSQILPKLARLAVTASPRVRRRVQRLLSTSPAAPILAEPMLKDPSAEIRRSAAEWLASLAPQQSVESLRAACATEEDVAVRASMLKAMRACGEDLTELLSADQLQQEAMEGLEANPAAGPDWLDWDGLPTVHWRDGGPVSPQVIRWWVTLAVIMKDPDGRGLIGLYLSLLDPQDSRRLALHLVRAWVARDTAHPSPEQSLAHAQDIGMKQYQYFQRYWTSAAQSDDPEEREAARQGLARPLENYVKAIYDEHQGTYLGSAMADKGLMAFAVGADGGELATLTHSYMRSHRNRRPQYEVLIRALRANGQDPALQVLIGVAQRHKMASLQKTARELLDEVAVERGWSAEQLEDRTIPTAGFGSDGLLHLSYGARSFAGRLTADFKISLTGPDGKARASLPAPRADDDADAVKAAKKQLTASRKEAKNVLSVQSGRLYEAMCAERGWSPAEWRDLLLAHPLMRHLVTRVIWQLTPTDSGEPLVFRPTPEGDLVAADDAVVDLPSQGEITVAHGTVIGPDAVAAWCEHLTDYEVEPLFDQLSALAPVITPGQQRLTDLRGHMTDAYSVRNVASKRGYRHGGMEDGGWFTEYLRTIPTAGLTVALTFTGAFVSDGNTPCATDSLELRRGTGRRLVALDEVPTPLLAECYADYAALAALGAYDPDWEDRTRPY